MGWASIDELPTIFAKQLANAQKGEIVPGHRNRVLAIYYIIKVNDIRGASNCFCD